MSESLGSPTTGYDRETARRLLETLRSAKRVRIGTHVNPDGDALGSALALSHWLDARGISNEVLCQDPAPAHLQFLPGVERLRLEPDEATPDVAAVLDLEALHRLGRLRSHFEAVRPLVVVDHHVPQEAAGDLRLIDTSAAATAVLVAELLLDADRELSPDIATCLLTGLVTDTGSFRYRNVNARALRLAAELVERGANLPLITSEVYQRKRLGAVRLLGRALENLCVDEPHRLAWSTLSPEDFAAAGATREDTESIVNEILAIGSVDVAILLRQAEPGPVWVSLRSRDSFDVGRVAARFGGGGHPNAAGCTFRTSLEEATRLVTEAVRSWSASS